MVVTEELRKIMEENQQNPESPFIQKLDLEGEERT